MCNELLLLKENGLILMKIKYGWLDVGLEPFGVYLLMYAIGVGY